MEKAAELICEKFDCAVLLKGGHQLNDANDLLFQKGKAPVWFHGKRIDNSNTHGTGCTLSSAIASNLAKGRDLETSVKYAKNYISGALAAMLDLENASSNDQSFTHSDLRRVARSIPQFIPGTDYICSGYSSTPNYDNMFAGSNWDADDYDDWCVIQRDLRVDAGLLPAREEEVVAARNKAAKAIQALFRELGLPEITDEEVINKIGLPCFIKPNAGGSSFGVTKVKTKEDIQPAIEKAFEESDEVMIEAFMKGTEITCGCYKTSDKEVVFPITEVVSANEFFDYGAKYNGESQEITPARLPEDTAERVRLLTSAIYDILGCSGLIRIDYIITEGEKVNLLEINTTPGMTATSFIPQQVRAAGLDIKDVMTDIIENKF